LAALRPNGRKQKPKEQNPLKEQGLVLLAFVFFQRLWRKVDAQPTEIPLR
jgi:hypothetical protein